MYVLRVLEGFMSKSGKKKLFHFFQVLRANKRFKWTPKCEEEFQPLKIHLETLSPLHKAILGDAMYLCLNSSLVSIHFILVKEDAKSQV